MGMDLTIDFEPRDADVQELWQELGVPEKLIDRGELTATELSHAGVDVPVFLKLLQVVDATRTGRESTLFDNIPNGFLYLSEEDAADAVDFIHGGYSPLLKSLLHYGDCPDGETARIIFSNLFTDSVRFYDEFQNGVVPERLCSRAELQRKGFMTEDMEGVFGTDATEDAAMQGVGQSVVPVTTVSGNGDVYSGSAVILSRSGICATAAHVLYQSAEELFPEINVTFAGRDYVVNSDDVLFVDHPADKAYFYVPQLAENNPNLPFAKLADRAPSEGEDVTVIGYPLLREEGEAGAVERTYTVGQFFYPHRDILVNEDDPLLNQDDRVFLLTTARMVPGDSGGGYFNARGELIGIASNFEPGENVSDAASLLPADIDDEREHGILARVNGERE